MYKFKYFQLKTFLGLVYVIFFRFDSKNSHQSPCVVVLCGNHNQGGLGLSTARQLLTHDIDCTVVTPRQGGSRPYSTELHLLEKCGGLAIVNSIAELSRASYYDLVVDARLDHSSLGQYWLCH